MLTFSRKDPYHGAASPSGRRSQDDCGVDDDDTGDDNDEYDDDSRTGLEYNLLL